MRKFGKILIIIFLSVIFTYLIYSKFTQSSNCTSPTINNTNNFQSKNITPTYAPKSPLDQNSYKLLTYSFDYPVGYKVNCYNEIFTSKICDLSNTNIRLLLISNVNTFLTNKIKTFNDFMYEETPNLYGGDKPASVLTNKGSVTINSERIASSEKLINDNGVTYYKVFVTMVERHDNQIFKEHNAVTPSYFFDLSSDATISAMIIKLPPDNILSSSNEAIIQQIISSIKPSNKYTHLDF